MKFHYTTSLRCSVPEKAAKILDELIADPFHKKLLAAAIKSLSEAGNPLAFNNFCSAYRELVRHVLSSLAPDTEILRCSWYEPDKSSKTGITRAHAVSYIVQGGLSDEYVSEELGIDAKKERKALLSAINGLNKYVHVNEETFGIDEKIASGKASKAIGALIEALRLSETCRDVLARSLESKIHDEVVATAIGDTIQSIDELATHHFIDEVYVGEIRVVRVDSALIHIKAIGSIGVELQWGSRSDLARGDGATLGKSFPLSCELQSEVDSPNEFHVVESTLSVDTSSWWEGYYDET
jgi:hypothetical protein